MLAHLVQTGFGVFYDGLAHWALSPRDLLVVMALALLAGFAGKKAARAAVLVLPLSWLMGGLLGFHLPTIGELSLLTTLTIGGAGLLVVLGRSPSPLSLAIFGVAAGLLHGLANGSVMLAENRDRLTLLGVVAAVSVVMLIGAAAGTGLKTKTGRIILRVAGSWITAIALLMLGWQFRS